MNFTIIMVILRCLIFSGGLTVVIPVGETTAQTGIMQLNDGIDEGEPKEIWFQPYLLIMWFTIDNTIFRVYDANLTDP